MESTTHSSDMMTSPSIPMESTTYSSDMMTSPSIPMESTTHSSDMNFSTANPDAGLNVHSDDNIWIIVYAGLLAMLLVFVVLAMVICRYTFYQRGSYYTSEARDLDTEDGIVLKEDPGIHDTSDQEED